MNERIKELKQQAMKTQVNYPEGWEEICESELEKFAELIVKDCAMLARKMEIHNVPFIGMKILEHFGVK